jgi:hypothetical protein
MSSPNEAASRSTPIIGRAEAIPRVESFTGNSSAATTSQSIGTASTIVAQISENRAAAENSLNANSEARSAKDSDEQHAPGESAIETACRLRDELTMLDQQQADTEVGYRQRQYRLLQAVYELAERLRTEDEHWHTFAESDFWKLGSRRPQLDHQSTAMEYVLRIVFAKPAGPAVDSGSKRRSLCRRALKELAFTNTPAASIAETLAARGGITALASAWSARRRRERPASPVHQSLKLVLSLPDKDQLVAKLGSTCTVEIRVCETKAGKAYLSLLKFWDSAPVTEEGETQPVLHAKNL